MGQIVCAFVWQMRKQLPENDEDKVVFIDPFNTHIEEGVEIGKKTVVYPYTLIEGQTKIGDNCVIGPHSTIRDSKIRDGVVVFKSTILKSIVRHHAQIGEAMIERSVVDHHATLGYTAQLKRTVFGARSKMVHHGYLGDCRVGTGVNIGAGAITANYDGVKKNLTIMEGDAFVGTNVNLVAPIMIPQGTMVASGSTITGKDEMRPWKLIIARARAYLVKSKRVFKDEKGWHLLP